MGGFFIFIHRSRRRFYGALKAVSNMGEPYPLKWKPVREVESGDSGQNRTPK
jgi:hypothetical protein